MKKLETLSVLTRFFSFPRDKIFGEKLLRDPSASSKINGNKKMGPEPFLMFLFLS